MTAEHTDPAQGIGDALDELCQLAQEAPISDRCMHRMVTARDKIAERLTAAERERDEAARLLWAMRQREEQANRIVEEYVAERDTYRAALNDIAAWRDGPEVGSHFDEPGAAETARRALAQHAQREGA